MLTRKPLLLLADTGAEAGKTAEEWLESSVAEKLVKADRAAAAVLGTCAVDKSCRGTGAALDEKALPSAFWAVAPGTVEAPALPPVPALTAAAAVASGETGDRSMRGDARPTGCCCCCCENALARREGGVAVRAGGWVGREIGWG